MGEVKTGERFVVELQSHCLHCIPFKSKQSVTLFNRNVVRYHNRYDVNDTGTFQGRGKHIGGREQQIDVKTVLGFHKQFWVFKIAREEVT